MEHIHIFKTDITTEKLPIIHQIFCAINSVLQWNVDTEDCDMVLRVVSHELSENDIISLVSGHGFFCQELDD